MMLLNEDAPFLQLSAHYLRFFFKNGDSSRNRTFKILKRGANEMRLFQGNESERRKHTMPRRWRCGAARLQKLAFDSAQH
jgi:hypothetical protein